MGNEDIGYKSLTELLLLVIRKRPAMYLREANISNLAIFITGYRSCLNSLTDEYFGENGFLKWMDQKYNIGQPNSWTTPFLDEADCVEQKALELYFKYLDEYHREKIFK